MLIRLFFIVALLAATESSVSAFERARSTERILSPTPEKVVRLEKKGRMPASVDSKIAARKAHVQELDEKLKVGTNAILQKTTEEWNDEVVKIVARYEDGRRKVQRPNGGFAFVEFDNLHTLAPETEDCRQAISTLICKGDTVYHPMPSASMGAPEGKVVQMFENDAVVVRDGLDYVYDAKQLGKAADCSPQKETVCVGKTVYVQGYRNGSRYDFEGPVEKVYTDGTVLVKNGLGVIPMDVRSVLVQTDALAGSEGATPEGAVVTKQQDPSRVPASVVYPDVEPFDADDAQDQEERYKGISIPARIR